MKVFKFYSTVVVGFNFLIYEFRESQPSHESLKLF